MAIINISSLPFSAGDEIAQNLASHLGYQLIGEDVFQEASKRSGMSLGKLREAFHSMPLLLGMSAATRKQCFAHVHAVLAQRFLEQKLIYHGPFGQFLAKGVSHILTVRIHSRLEDRVTRRASQEGAGNKAAERAILREDRQRLMIAKQVFNMDDNETSHFDLVINSSQMDADTAVEVISETASLKRYSPMTYSVQCMEDIALARKVKSSIVDIDPDVGVEVNRGNVKVRTRIYGSAKKKRADKIRKRLAEFEGMKNLEVDVVQDTFGRIAGSLR
jgi:cytidylate kinase